jgi:serine/threonine protein kinase
MIDHTSKPTGAPVKAEYYELIEEIGIGTSSSVWKALCKPLNKNVAIKRMDMEQYPILTLEKIRVCLLQQKLTFLEGN